MHVVFPGSFDPVTNGHLNIIERCSRMFDSVDVVIADNPSKQILFSVEERFAHLSELLTQYQNVKLFVWKKLMVHFLKERDSNIIIRGVRSSADYEYEYALANLNKGLGKGTETILIPTDEKYFVLRSSMIKEIVMLGGDVSDKVPPIILEVLKKKLSDNGVNN